MCVCQSWREKKIYQTCCNQNNPVIGSATTFTNSKDKQEQEKNEVRSVFDLAVVRRLLRVGHRSHSGCAIFIRRYSSRSVPLDFTLFYYYYVHTR